MIVSNTISHCEINLDIAQIKNIEYASMLCFGHVNNNINSGTQSRGKSTCLPLGKSPCTFFLTSQLTCMQASQAVVRPYYNLSNIFHSSLHGSIAERLAKWQAD
jgi:hypothetical protein